MPNPISFISYSWDSDDHKNWVRYLSEQLQQAGVKTFLDQWDLKLGMNIMQWIEDSISSSNYILLICTPKFAERANKMEGGVGQEKIIIGGEMYYKLRPQTSFIPIIRSGYTQDALPRYLGAAKWIDFREDESFGLAFEELLRHIYDSPKFIRPELGRKPKFISINDTIKDIGNNTVSRQSGMDEIYGLSSIANRWKKKNSPYYIVEELSRELRAIVRHPPSDMKRIDEPLKSFLLLSGLHYGGNWFHWLNINLKNKNIIDILLTALSTSYDRVKFRAIYAMQFINHKDLLEYIDTDLPMINENTKDFIKKIVIPKKAKKYIKDSSKSDDRRLADKAMAVMREIEGFEFTMK